MSESQRTFIIGIAGGTASGKSTIAKAIVDSVGEENITHLLHDFYYKDIDDLPKAEDLTTINFDHPDALDTPLMIRHLKRLQAGEKVEIPIYDFVKYARSPQTQTAFPHPVIIVEGILVLVEPALREMFSVKIFVDTPDDLRFIRRLRRDIDERGRTMESVIEQYLTTVRPMHEAFVEPSKVYADLIIPQGGFNAVAIDIVAARISSILNKRGITQKLP